MAPNLVVIFLAALVPLVLGGLWYSKLMFLKPWMRESGMTEEAAQSGNMLLIFGLTYVFGVFAAVILFSITVHQTAIYSLLMGQADFFEEGSKTQLLITDLMKQYGNEFRTFKHGMLHGGIAGFMLVTPALAVNSLFERKSFKYIAINAGYWIIALMLMGGIVCQFG